MYKTYFIVLELLLKNVKVVYGNKLFPWWII